MTIEKTQLLIKMNCFCYIIYILYFTNSGFSQRHKKSSKEFLERTFGIQSPLLTASTPKNSVPSSKEDISTDSDSLQKRPSLLNGSKKSNNREFSESASSDADDEIFVGRFSKRAVRGGLGHYFPCLPCPWGRQRQDRNRPSDLGLLHSYSTANIQDETPMLPNTPALKFRPNRRCILQYIL